MKLDITFSGGGMGGQKFVFRSLCSARFEQRSDWADWAEMTGQLAVSGRPTGIRTADLQVCGRVHYRSTVA